MSVDASDVHLWTAEETSKNFGVSASSGLTDAKVESIRATVGYNELDKEEGKSVFELILEQFDDALVKILLGAAAVSTLIVVGESGLDGGITAFVEPLVILIILILNAGVGVWQESNAEAALEALKDLQPENARVMRGGEWSTIGARELVPGDVVQVRVGDKIPADMRLISLSTTTMRCDQAGMTGESQSVSKDTDELEGKKSKFVIQDKVNMLFAATTVTNGMGEGIVTATGMNTEIGEIQKAVKDASEDEEDTPLKKKIDQFGDLLAKIIGIICLVVWIINYNNFFDPAHGSVFKGCIYYFKIAVALAVAAIPEGLPAVITTCLALGTRKMAKKNAIVRKLPSVETLGCTTVICSDKTGTLTTNEMTVLSVVHCGGSPSDLNEYPVTGLSYDPNGEVKGVDNTSSDLPEGLVELAKVCSLCNEAKIAYNGEERAGGGGPVGYERFGEPTEAALKILVEKLGQPSASDNKTVHSARASNPGSVVNAANEFYEGSMNKIATLEFSRDRKSMSVLCNTGGSSPKAPGRVTRSSAVKAPGGGAGGNVLYVKGAPEGMIERCTTVRLANGNTAKLDKKGKDAILSKVEEMAGKAWRTLALAVKEDTGELASYDGSHTHPAHKTLCQVEKFGTIESGMTFVGLVGIIDPPRPEVRPSIEKCNLAGIRVVVITGDNKTTAESVCRSIGVFDETESLTGKSFTGTEFFEMKEDAQLKILNTKGGRVFSRTEPKDKQALVKLLKSQGEIVAMTGDGVNDAPALKQADIGIAMGITGTEVAKEAADMVLADDNFATIVSAVEEGRSIYMNMQAFIRYLISSNIGEVAAIFFTAALGMPEGLIPVQLLWVNLVTDGPPATALGFNPPDKDIMRKLPRRADDDLITPWVFFRYMVVGLYVGFACVGIFGAWYMFPDTYGGFHPSAVGGQPDGHSAVTYHQLTHWGQCAKYYGRCKATADGCEETVGTPWENFAPKAFTTTMGIEENFDADPCTYFTDGKKKASTLSLSVLVVIEMLNALNALSEDGSLVQMPPWVNPYLILAMLISFGMHAVILYIPSMAEIFFVQPLDLYENIVVFAWSMPVIFIDEVLKCIGRYGSAAELKARIAENKKRD
jgi:Ca2+-transporting ATPase